MLVSLCLPGSPVRLANQTHSLGRFSKRTTRHRLPMSPTATLRSCRLSLDLLSLVARSPTDFRRYCTSLCGVLFSVRSRYLFAIGLESCLVFAVNARGIHKEYPIPATLELTHAVLTQRTGLSPCIALHSRRLRLSGRALRVSPNTTLPVRASVWTGSRLLAVTNDIPFGFFSCRY